MMLSLGLATQNTGCLVTEDLLFEGQEDVPPAFVFKPRSIPAIGATLLVDTDQLESEGRTELTFELQVRDDNVLQDLETQIRLRTNEVVIKDVEPGVIRASGNAIRDVKFRFLAAELRDGQCHQLEFAVSGNFLEFEEERIFAFPEVEDDLAIATWWLWETNADTTPPVDFDTCPTSDFP